MHGRLAFTARFWGDGAVVCRAVEDQPGPLVEQQFGLFPTWTQASNLAARPNEGLDLRPVEVRQIVTSSLLATACVVHAALAENRTWHNSPVGLAARAAQIRFVLAELALARTFCRSARTLLSGQLLERMLHQARIAFWHGRQFLALSDDDAGELEDIAGSLTALASALDAPPHFIVLTSCIFHVM